jgi:ribosomal protein S18 acetylase RimI-like enzyme
VGIGERILRLLRGHAEAQGGGPEDLEGQAVGITVRKYRPGDRRAVLRIAAESFDGVCLDQNIEEKFGRVGGRWRDHKKDAVEYDLTRNSTSAFVAVSEGEVIGFVCNRLYHSRSIGHVANLAVRPEFQGRGAGRALLNATLEYFREQGMRYARIETLKQNERARRFYPSLGFEVVGEQIYYFTRL